VGRKPATAATEKEETVSERMDERFETEEPETDDVEGHRLVNKDEEGDERAAGRQADRTANAGDDDDFEAHRLVDRQMDRTANDKNID
jgi:hypothetical protein